MGKAEVRVVAAAKLAGVMVEAIVGYARSRCTGSI